VLAWAEPLDLAVSVVPGTDHFFHRKLHLIRDIIHRAWDIDAPGSDGPPCSALRKSYAARSSPGLTFALRPRRMLRPARPQRRRQDHHAALLPRPHGARRRQHPPRRRPVPEQAREARRRVGVVPQFDNLDPDFTAAENLLVYGRYFGIADAEIRPHPRPARIRRPGRPRKRQDPRLSGGMKRRLTLARALVNDPELLFLDEPTTGLDPQARHLIWERLKRLLQQGKTVLLTTHFMDEAERLCHRLAIMDGGRFIAEGSPRELIAAHIEPQVVEVYGEESAPPLGQARSAAVFAARRNHRRNRLLLCHRRRAAAAPPRRPPRPALPAPSGQPRGRFPQAHRARPARD
jgi:ABC-type Na+ transport system ATPase subunit NatA